MISCRRRPAAPTGDHPRCRAQPSSARLLPRRGRGAAQARGAIAASTRRPRRSCFCWKFTGILACSRRLKAAFIAAIITIYNVIAAILRTCFENRSRRCQSDIGLVWTTLRDGRVAPSRDGGSPDLFDDLVGAGEDRLRHGEAERLGGFKIDDQLELGRLLDRQIGWLFPLEDPSGVNTGLAKQPGDARPV